MFLKLSILNRYFASIFGVQIYAKLQSFIQLFLSSPQNANF